MPASTGQFITHTPDFTHTSPQRHITSLDSTPKHRFIPEPLTYNNSENKTTSLPRQLRHFFPACDQGIIAFASLETVTKMTFPMPEYLNQ